MRVCIAAGGTGGHLYPGIALAYEMIRQEAGSTVQFVGTRRGLEARVLPELGFELCCIAARGVVGMNPMNATRGLLTIPYAIGQCIRLLRKKRSELVIGIGGYTSPPLLLAALLLKIPRVIVEPNVVPGLANRVLSRIADVVLLAFDEATPYFKRAMTQVVGTPLRPGFRSSPFLDACRQAAGEASPARQSEMKTLLILGGSRGAHAINRAMIDALPRLAERRSNLKVIHQTGEEDRQTVHDRYAAVQFDADVVAMVLDMPKAYAQADLVISRAGAVTIAELTACGKPAVLIPFPHAAGNHQLWNARFLQRAGAAELIEQRCLDGNVLADAITALLDHPERLAIMEARSRALGRHDAAERSIESCRELVRKSSRSAA